MLFFVLLLIRKHFKENSKIRKVLDEQKRRNLGDLKFRRSARPCMLWEKIKGKKEASKGNMGCDSSKKEMTSGSVG